MDNSQNIRIVLGSLRYKSAPDVDFRVDVPLIQTNKTNIEFDRSSTIDLQILYEQERQSSTIFRPTSKFEVIFKNSYVGKSTYTQFQNNLYLVNTAVAAANSCTNPSLLWTGYPQYNEFDFIRTDYDVLGYTQPPSQHLTFVPSSASSYNWNFYVSYAYDNIYTKQMQAIEPYFNQTLNWIAGDGIPFIVESGATFNGQPIIRFRCPMKHGLIEGEFVELNFSYGIDSVFAVYTIGDDSYTGLEYIFNIYDVGFTGTTFQTGTKGTFKRVISIDNTGETTSKYYVRRNKIISNASDYVLAKAGFEQNIFGIKKKYESSAYTPNNISRVSVLDGGQSYTLTFAKDFDLGGLIDNQKRPLLELFVTAMWKGYFGWTTGSLKQGWEFNIPPDLTTKYPNAWWSNTNSNSNTPFTTSSYVSNGKTFNYVNSLSSDTIVDGDYCEWNDYEQTERVISNLYHKFKFNPVHFNIGTPPSLINPYGYYYQTHFPIPLRITSDYIETAPPENIYEIPNWAFFSSFDNEFKWRDVYSYGFIDYKNRGVDYPFMNGKHYPFKNIIFRIIPEGTNYSGNDFIVPEPLSDECE